MELKEADNVKSTEATAGQSILQNGLKSSLNTQESPEKEEGQATPEN